MALDAKGIRLDANAERHTGRVDILLAQFNKDGSVLGTPAMQTSATQYAGSNVSQVSGERA